MPVSFRLHYLKQFLESLSKNDLTDYTLFCGIEPGNDEIAQICRNIDFVKTHIIQNRKVLGVRKNPFNILETAFRNGSEFNIHLEDDLLVSPDMINLANWYYMNFKSNPDKYAVYGLFAYDSNPEQVNLIKEVSRFDGLGWCCFKENWNLLFRKYWFKETLWDKLFGKTGWDWAVQKEFQKRHLKGLKPAFSRSNHNGREGGTFSIPEKFDEVFKNIKFNKTKVITEFLLDL